MEEQGKDVVAILEKMQQQLTYLEKKIDTLIQNSQQKPAFERERSFSKPPFRSFGRPHRPEGGNGRPSYGPGRSQNSYGGGHGGNEGGNRDGNFRPKKKPFFGGRSNRER